MTHGDLAKELRDLMRTRTCDISEWERIWRGAGAASGILDDMSDAQLREVIEQVRRLLQTRKAG